MIRNLNKFAFIMKKQNETKYLLVFGRIRLVLFGLAPSKMFSAALSSGEICLNAGFGFLIGEVRDFIFSFSISNRIFSFRRRRSSSFESRIRLGLAGSVISYCKLKVR